MNFNLLDFCKLMISNMKIENIDKFNVNTIGSELVPFYNDNKYKLLFSNMHIDQLEEISNIKETLFDMLDGGYYYFYTFTNTPNIYHIALQEEQAKKFISLYKKEYQLLMNDLIKKYKMSKIDNNKTLRLSKPN